MAIESLNFLQLTEKLMSNHWIDSHFLMQQAPNMSNDIRYSIGLVIVCLIVLVLLWLPDMLRKEGE